MNVNGIGNANPVQKIVTTPINRSVPAEPPAQLPATAPADKVEVSSTVAQFLQALKANDIRADKVADIKAQIANNTYEDDKKLDGAIDKLLDDLTK